MLINQSISQLAKQLQAKQISSEDLVKEVYQTIKKHDQDINSFITLKEEKTALKQARQLDQERNDQSSLLHGLPYSMKDAYVTKELPTTAASKVLANFQSPYDATVQRKLKEAGGLLIGKNNLDAWGHGASNENSDFGIVKNPWDLSRVAGGSSGGSGAAVAARMVPFAIGEDTGGSIRNPASMCSISGLKVTYGRVSRYGAISYASSLDTVGPMAKNVEDLAILLKNMAGIDEFDASSSDTPVDDYLQFLNQSIEGKTIGFPKEFFAEGIDPEIKKVIDAALKEFEKLGAKPVEVSIPFLKYAVPIYYFMAMSETSSNLARYDQVRFGQDRALFTPDNKTRIILGTYGLSAGYSDKLYKNALRARTKLVDQYQQALSKCDVLLGPVTPAEPNKIGDLTSDPLKNLLMDMYTGTVNIVGLPSVAIPAGFTDNNLPIGMQLIGPMFEEKRILNFGHAYQQATDWHTKMPPILKSKEM